LDPAHLDKKFIENAQNPDFRVESFAAVDHFS